jgi:hypothetical protein
MTWQPISEADLQYLMANELGRLNDIQFQRWKRYAIKPEHVTCERGVMTGGPPVAEPIYIPARSEREVLLYDDVEEEFGTGTLDQDGVLRTGGTWGKAPGWALERFPESSSGGAA